MNVRKVNKLLAVVWAIMVPVSYFTGWATSIIFVSLCSIYANAISHWAAARADSENPS